MDRTKKKWIPQYAVVPLLSCITVNFIIYMWIADFAASWKHYDFTTAFDKKVPLVPEFVLVYLGCYVFWFVNYILIARQGKEHCYRFAAADIMSRLICCAFFLLLPTTNVRPELTGGGVCVRLLQFVYDIDAPTKLFPSVHCLVSWFSYIGIRGRKNIPRFYRAFSCIFALLVCVSTQFTKQHYVIDIFGGIAVAELTYYLAFRTDFSKPFLHIFERFYEKFFAGKGNPAGKRERVDK